MKSYILHAGSRYTLVEETESKMLISPQVARTDILFEDKELIEVDTVDAMLHFQVGNRHFYANNRSISVMH
jgi:hypothetical protein